MSNLSNYYCTALKYNSPPPREPGFEAAIDSNPTESHNHLVYADWLQEHGDEEEAAFRRSLGNWLGQHTFQKHPIGDYVGFHSNSNKTIHNLAFSPNTQKVDGHWQLWGPYNGTSHSAILPEGVELPDYWHDEPGQVGDDIIHDISGTLGIPTGTSRIEHEMNTDSPTPSHVARWQPHPIGVMTWPSYRDMEEGLRRAFKAKLRRNSNG